MDHLESLTPEQMRQALALLHDTNADVVNTVLRQIVLESEPAPWDSSPEAAAAAAAAAAVTLPTVATLPSGESLVGVLDGEPWVDDQQAEEEHHNHNNLYNTAAAAASAQVVAANANANATANEIWEKRFQELTLHKAQTGSCTVSSSTVSKGILYRWILAQRRQYRALQNKIRDGNASSHQIHLNEDRVTRLRSIGFMFETSTSTAASSSSKEGDSNNDEAEEDLEQDDNNNNDENNNIISNNENQYTWEEWYEMLKQYHDREGHTNVPQKYVYNNNIDLGLWVTKQRQNYKLLNKNKTPPSPLTLERINKLNLLQFNFNEIKKIPWIERYEHLKIYKQNNGHCRVPVRKGSHYTSLGKWVEHQRTQYRLKEAGKSSAMTQERIDLLEQIGFEWNILNKHQRQQQQQQQQQPDDDEPIELSSTTATHNNTNNNRKRSAVLLEDTTTTTTTSNTTTPTKKRSRKSSSSSIGGGGGAATATTASTPGVGGRSKQNKKWNDRYEELKLFTKQHGHCRVAAGKGKKNNYSKLGKWVEHQRTQYRLYHTDDKKSSMTPERIQKLQEIGFEFVVEKKRAAALQQQQQQAAATSAGIEEEEEPTNEQQQEEQENNDDYDDDGGEEDAAAAAAEAVLVADAVADHQSASVEL